MNKIKGKGKLLIYGCSGLGVNMLNVIMGSYLCSALLIGGFEKHVESWTYLNKDLVLAGVGGGLWGLLILVSKIIDGLIDLPLSHFADNLKSKWGKRKTAIVIGFIPMIIAYVLFLVPLQNKAGLVNTIWFAALLIIFYAFYTLTMITYYATFAEITEKQEDIVFLSNVKSVCDVVYFSLGFALVPAFVSMGLNIRKIALIFLPLSLTMLIPMFLLKEKNEETLEDSLQKPKVKINKEKTTFIDSFLFTIKDRPFIFWLCIVFIMNMGLQLFLSGINEFFSSAGLNMTVIMATCFVPVPFTIVLYNKIVQKRGLGFAFRYILLVFSIGMSLMGLSRFIPSSFVYPFAIMCSLIVSFSIGAFFSVTYTVPSQRAAARKENTQAASSMYFAIQGLFEGASAGVASGVILVTLKETEGSMEFLTVIVATFCMIAFGLSFFLSKSIIDTGRKA